MRRKLFVQSVVPAVFTQSYTGIGNLPGIPTPLGWWGLRGYTAAYSGNCIQISDQFFGNTQDIGLVNHYVDVASIITWELAHGQSYVSKWYDQSGNGLDMGIGNQIPTFNQNLLSGFPAVRFVSSTGAYLKNLTGIVQNAPYFTSWVARRITNFSTVQEVFGTGDGVRSGFSATPNFIGMSGGGSGIAAAVDNVFHAAQLNYMSGTNSSIMVDGTTTTGLNVFPINMTSQIAIGGPGFAQDLDAEVCEVGVWGGDQSANFSAINTNQHGSSGYNF
jgi:hypothetical protein